MLIEKEGTFWTYSFDKDNWSLDTLRFNNQTQVLLFLNCLTEEGMSTLLSDWLAKSRFAYNTEDLQLVIAEVTVERIGIKGQTVLEEVGYIEHEDGLEHGLVYQHNYTAEEKSLLTKLLTDVYREWEEKTGKVSYLYRPSKVTLYRDFEISNVK